MVPFSDEPTDPAHVHPETLALVALGERAASTPDLEHLRGCSRCQSELDELTAVVRTGRTVTSQDIPQQPSAQVWARIRAELDAPEPLSRAPRHRKSRGRMVALLAAAACTGVLAGIGGTLLTQSRDDGTGTVLASGRLEPLAMKDAAGEVRVTGTERDRRLTLSVSGMPAQAPGGGYYQVWLLDRGAKRLVALGALGADETGTYLLPPGLDLSAYPVVDVSVEPDDGNPAHSSVSAARGDLRT